MHDLRGATYGNQEYCEEELHNVYLYVYLFVAYLAPTPPAELWAPHWQRWCTPWVLCPGRGSPPQVQWCAGHAHLGYSVKCQRTITNSDQAVRHFVHKWSPIVTVVTMTYNSVLFEVGVCGGAHVYHSSAMKTVLLGACLLPLRSPQRPAGLCDWCSLSPYVCLCPPFVPSGHALPGYQQIKRKRVIFQYNAHCTIQSTMHIVYVMTA